MNKPFIHARTRINWAKEYISKFERRAQLFFDKTRAQIVVEPEANGTTQLYKFRFVKPFPPILTQQTVTAIENLRSALDGTAVEVARLCHVPDLDSVHFPFAKAGADLKSRVRSCAKHLPEDIQTLFSSFKPYRGGDDILWCINELANTSKHRILLSIAPHGGISIPEMETSDAFAGPIELLEGVHYCAENEVTFARTPVGLKWKYHLQASFGISFGEFPVIQAMPVYPVLRKMQDTVIQIVDRTEAKCREIGLL